MVKSPGLVWISDAMARMDGLRCRSDPWRHLSVTISPNIRQRSLFSSSCDGTLVDITEQGTATQELRGGQAYRDQGETLSHTGSFGRKLSIEELVRTRLFDSLSTIEASQTLDLFRAHTTRRFEFGPAECQEQSEANFPSYAPHVLRKYNGSHPDVHVTLIGI